MPAFSFSPRATFPLLKKLDLAFYALLRGVDTDANDQLPGFETGRATPSTTEQVRLRGIVQRTRVVVVEVAGKGGDSIQDMSTVSSVTEETADEDGDHNMTDMNYDDDDDHDTYEMDIARVYERTLVELNQNLQDSVGPTGPD